MFACNYPGSVGSSCSYSIAPAIMESCADICVEGACEGVVCYDDSDCDDSNDYTEDVWGGRMYCRILGRVVLFVTRI